MKRVIINPTTFKLSAAGFDASTDSGTNIILDGFGPYAYNGVYLSGVVGSSALTLVGSYWRGIVNFGKTFDSQPQCLVRFQATDGGSLMRDWANGKAGSTDGTHTAILTTTSTLEVRQYFSGSTFQQKVSFSYLILQV